MGKIIRIALGHEQAKAAQAARDLADLIESGTVAGFLCLVVDNAESRQRPMHYWSFGDLTPQEQVYGCHRMLQLTLDGVGFEELEA